jgi:hypothetical protein
MVMHELRQGYRGASGATMTRSRDGNGGGLEIGLLWAGIDNKEVVVRVWVRPRGVLLAINICWI